MFNQIIQAIVNFFQGLFGGNVARINPPTPLVHPNPGHKTLYGMELQFEFNINPPTFADLKPKIVRQDISTYDGNNDIFVDSMFKQGVKVILVGCYSYVNKPMTPVAMAQLFSTLATRYRGKVYGYEIINEANVPQGANGGQVYMSPEEYLAYLQLCFVAIRAADPNALIISTGTSGCSFRWQEELARLGAAKFIDRVAFHPYGETEATIVSAVDRLTTIWGKTPLSCTEFGDYNGNKSAKMLLLLNGWVTEAIFYNWKSDDFGLVNKNGRPRPGYITMKKLFDK